MRKILPSVLTAALMMSFVFSAVALPQAQAYDRAWHRAHWSQGHWIHDRHNGQLGWWWVIGGAWYFYPHPVAQPQTVIIQQQPAPQVIVQQAPPAQQVVVQQAPPPPPAAAMTVPQTPVTPVMYYCKATGTYYPETMTCPGGWTTVQSGQPPAP